MNKKQFIMELTMPICFAFFAIYIIVKAIPMDSEGVFPIMSALILLICAVYLFVETCIKKEVIVKLKDVNLLKVGITFAALIVYVILLKIIGYMLSTCLLCAFIIRFLGYRNVWITLACSMLAVGITFFVFKVLLSVPLPMVFLDF